MRCIYCIVFVILIVTAACGSGTPYWVRIVDAETGRGVPLVEFRSPNAVSFWTDSNGIATIDDPAFEGRNVAFLIRSDGYEFQEKLFCWTMANAGSRLTLPLSSSEGLKTRR